MSDEIEEPLSEGERRLLASLRETPPPPVGLEERVAARARRAGAFSAGRRRSLVARAAGLLLAFLGGALVQSWLGPRGPNDPGQATYMLLLHEPADQVAALDGEEHASRAVEYGAWSVEHADRVVGGAPLSDGPGIVRRDDEGRLEIAAAPAPRTLEGYFLLEARSDSEALELAASCPHLDYGGWIEVRPLGH